MSSIFDILTMKTTFSIIIVLFLRMSNKTDLSNLDNRKSEKIFLKQFCRFFVSYRDIKIRKNIIKT